MKSLIALLLTISSLSALAGEIPFFDRPTMEYWRVISFTPEFAINKDLGRAWVEVDFLEMNEGPITTAEKVKIEGLSFNTTTSQIQLDVEGVQIICANVKINFWGTKIKPTGKCVFKQTTYTVQVDDGYEINTIERRKISLKY